MKTLLMTASLALILLAGCADMDGGNGGLQVTHPSPEMEMTKSTCCLKPPQP